MHGTGVQITKNHSGSRFPRSVRVKLSAWHKYPIQDHHSSSSNTKPSTSWMKLLAWRGLQVSKLSYPCFRSTFFIIFNTPLPGDPLSRLCFFVLWPFSSCANQTYIYYLISFLHHYLCVFRGLPVVFRGLCHRL